MNPLPPLPPVYKKIFLFTVLFFVILIPIVFFVSSVRNARVVDLFSTDTTSSSGSASQTPPQNIIIEDPDSIRVTHLRLIKDKIADALKRKVDIPLPENALEVTFGEKKMGYQGVAGKALFDAIGLDFPRDPVTNDMYYYFFHPETKEYQILGFLDSEKQSNTLINKRPAYTLGSTDGNFLLTGTGELAVSILKTAQKIDTSDSASRKLLGLSTFQSCKDIRVFSEELKSGKYMIEMNGKPHEVYCDMVTDGGGWTLFYANNGYEDSPIAKSYVEMRDVMETDLLLDLSKYDEKYLVGLLNYKHFTQLGASEVLIRNRIGDVKKWVKFTFSTSRALEWSLGPLVLGKTEYGCIDLPRRATWNILSSDTKVKYEKLTQIMNHGGTSWGVSHDKYLCNFFITGVNPHIGFYNSTGSAPAHRARSSDSLGGDSFNNEYRYFIR